MLRQLLLLASLLAFAAALPSSAQTERAQEPPELHVGSWFRIVGPEELAHHAERANRVVTDFLEREPLEAIGERPWTFVLLDATVKGGPIWGRRRDWDRGRRRTNPLLGPRRIHVGPHPQASPEWIERFGPHPDFDHSLLRAGIEARFHDLAPRRTVQPQWFWGGLVRSMVARALALEGSGDPLDWRADSGLIDAPQLNYLRHDAVAARSEGRLPSATSVLAGDPIDEGEDADEQWHIDRGHRFASRVLPEFLLTSEETHAPFRRLALAMAAAQRSEIEDDPAGFLEDELGARGFKRLDDDFDAFIDRLVPRERPKQAIAIPGEDGLLTVFGDVGEKGFVRSPRFERRTETVRDRFRLEVTVDDVDRLPLWLGWTADVDEAPRRFVGFHLAEDGTVAFRLEEHPYEPGQGQRDAGQALGAPAVLWSEVLDQWPRVLVAELVKSRLRIEVDGREVLEERLRRIERGEELLGKRVTFGNAARAILLTDDATARVGVELSIDS